MSDPVLTEIDFDDIKTIWAEHLWPGKRGPIRPLSSISHTLTYDMSIYQTATPHFIGLVVDKKIIGVNSGFKTSNDFYRSRGLWVHPDHRKKGYSKLLLTAVEDEARRNNGRFLWSLPREESIFAYQQFNFDIKCKVPPEIMDFHPNWLALKEIKRPIQDDNPDSPAR